MAATCKFAKVNFAAKKVKLQKQNHDKQMNELIQVPWHFALIAIIAMAFLFAPR